MPQSNPTSSSGQEQPQTAQTVPYPSPNPQYFEDDTIDLYGLWIILWNRKWLIIALTVVAALGSIVYALQLKRIYKAEARLLPPKTKDVQFLNVHGLQDRVLVETGNSVLTRITPNYVLTKFKQNLSSRNLLKKFIQENGLMELLAPDRNPKTRDEDIYSGFAGMIKLKDVKGFASLSIELHDAEIAAQWVNDLIEFVDKETIAMLVEDLRNSLADEVREIEYKISSKRQMAMQRKEDQLKDIQIKIKSKREMAFSRRNDKIKRYEEASIIAKSLGIESGFTQQTKLIESSSGSGTISPPTARESLSGNSPITQMNVDIATATTPLFYLGIDALQAELKVLKERENDDPFIPGLRELQEQLALLHSIESEDPFIEGLRDLQEQLALLRSIKFNQEKMSAVYIDQAAYPPNRPIKPNRRLIVSLVTVVGLFSGIFLVFLIEFVQDQRQKHLE